MVVNSTGARDFCARPCLHLYQALSNRRSVGPSVVNAFFKNLQFALWMFENDLKRLGTECSLETLETLETSYHFHLQNHLSHLRKKRRKISEKSPKKWNLLLTYHALPRKRTCYESGLKSGQNVCMNEWMNECLYEWVNEWMSEWMNKWTNEWMNEGIHECMFIWMSEWMNEQMNEWMSERMNE